MSSATVIAWVNPSQLQNDNTDIIVSHNGYSEATGNASGMLLTLNNLNNNVGYVWNCAQATYSWRNTLNIPTNEWSMIAITITSNVATAYLCKSSGITTATNNVTHSPISGLKFYIGVEPLDLSVRAFKGNIATSMVYSTALSLTQIESIYNAQKYAFSSVVIGNQTVMDKNWDVTTDRNGDLIPEVTDKTTWGSLTTGAWCYYKNVNANGIIYGKLYNWYAVNDPRGLAPVGWHVPSDAEWTALGASLGGDAVAGGKMKSTTLWQSPNTGATNESGFSGLPSGYRSPIDPSDFNNINVYTLWWCSDEQDQSNAYYRKLINKTSALQRNANLKNYGFPVRVIHD